MTLTNFPDGIETTALVLNGGTLAGAVIVQAITISPASVGAATCAEQIFACASADANDLVLSVTKPTAQAGLGIAGARVSSAGNIGINFVNATAAPIVPTAAQVYQIAILKLP